MMLPQENSKLNLEKPAKKKKKITCSSPSSQSGVLEKNASTPQNHSIHRVPPLNHWVPQRTGRRGLQYSSLFHCNNGSSVTAELDSLQSESYIGLRCYYVH